MAHRLITAACMTSFLLFGGCAKRQDPQDLEVAAKEVAEEARELGAEVERVAERTAERAREATERDEDQGSASPAFVRKAIPDARCERELRCDNIGTGEEYSTEKDCM